MKKAIFSAALCLLAGNFVFAQSNIAGLPPMTAGCVKPNQTQPIPWNYIAERDIRVIQRIWRDIDIHDERNRLLAANSQLAIILTEGFFNGSYKAYSAVNDRFTTPLTREEFIKLLTPGSGGFNPAVVTKYRIKEDWLYLKSSGAVEVRIVGIAPVAEVKDANGIAKEQPAFWIYYPDARKHLAQNKVINKEQPYIFNWDELFESRQFDGEIDKVIEMKK
ncbi:MAG: gliding motility associated protein GldN [Flavipsychrobacter sp.]|jgi:hypothetical protein|nr:gliding motility associated protein GldN [Flavipsychrobacter sp.]